MEDKARNESRRESSVIQPRRLPGGGMFASGRRGDVYRRPLPPFTSCSPWHRAAPPPHPTAAPAPVVGAKRRLRPRASPAEVAPLDHAGTQPGETSVQQGWSDVRDCFIRRIGAPLVVRGRLIDFISSNIHAARCCGVIQGFGLCPPGGALLGKTDSCDYLIM